jgi:hypothetical protein
MAEYPIIERPLNDSAVASHLLIESTPKDFCFFFDLRLTGTNSRAKIINLINQPLERVDAKPWPNS